jgi:2-polyprenyl-3-methyl-5-hydroxy-6-metoxy-1,4-benzoquinol methylase
LIAMEQLLLKDPLSATQEDATPNALSFEPHPAFVSKPMQNEPELARCLGKRIGILIVTYNAVRTLTSVLKRITPNVWANVEEIAVFDDASSDDTYELAVGLKALRNLKKLTVLKHQKNLGYGGNQKAGYRYFIDQGFDIVVLLHGDGQYAPEILSHIYSPIVRGEAEAVFGSRMMKTYGSPLKGGMPLYKYVGNRILSTFENWMLGLGLTEFHSGYRAYDMHALRKIDLTRMTDDFHFDTEIILKLHHQNYRIMEVPIPTYYGTELCYVRGLKYARDVVKAVWRYKQTCRSVKRYPEFEEYFVHYPLKNTQGSSHHYVIQMIGRNQDVLDLGCGAGLLARELQENGNRVTGVDALADVGENSPLERYYFADLDTGIGPVLAALNGKRFDCVLLLDVLEHLRRPESLLEECHKALQRNGRVIISVPNVANITVRLMILFGRFNYAERGILDKTHLRFFTRKTARRLIESGGFEIVEEKTTVMPVKIVLDLSPETCIMRAINRSLLALTKLFPTLLGYQFMFVAREKHG